MGHFRTSTTNRLRIIGRYQAAGDLSPLQPRDLKGLERSQCSELLMDRVLRLLSQISEGNAGWSVELFILILNDITDWKISSRNVRRLLRSNPSTRRVSQ